MRLFIAAVLLLGCAHGQGAHDHYAAWTTVETAHLAVHTALGKSEDEEVAQRLEEVFTALSRGFFPDTRLERVHVVVFAEPEDVASAASDAAANAPAGPMRGAIALTLRDRKRRRGGGGTGEDRFTSSWQTAAARELAHRLLNGVMDHPPPWLREGLGTYVSTVTIENGAAVFGHRPNDLAWDLAKGRALPLGELLAATNQDFHGGDGRVFEAGCWGFVHYLLGGEGGSLRDRFDTLTAALVHGADGRAAVAQAFSGVSWDELEGRVRSYQVDVLGRRSTFHPYPVSLPPVAPTRGTATASDPALIGGLLAALHRH